MEDKRRRARVQGAWAGPAKSQATTQPGKNLWGPCVNAPAFQLMLRNYLKRSWYFDFLDGDLLLRVDI